MGPLMPVDDALELLLEGAVCRAGVERIDIRRAAGRVAAKAVSAAINVPPADNSAMDGYAFAHAGVAEGATLSISMRIPAGAAPSALSPGTAARIFTGAPMPLGADTVVMQEDTRAEGDAVTITELPALHNNVRLAGQDIAVGSEVIAAGRRLRAPDLGLATSVGVHEIDTYEPLRVALMATGDELVEPPQPLRPGQIYNSSHYALAALLERDGFEVVDLGLVADTQEATEAALTVGATRADCILSTGGVSVGEEDHVKRAVEATGALDLWRLRIKPGKPLAFGRVGDTPFFGLPGNPVSTFVTYWILARPWLLSSQGCTECKPNWFHALARFEFRGGSRREYLRVRLERDSSGQEGLTKYPNQGSGVLSSVAWATGLAEIEVEQQVSIGDRVRYYPTSI